MATVSVVRNAHHSTLETQNKKHCSTLVYNMLEEGERERSCFEFNSSVSNGKKLRFKQGH